ncbi:MAG: hypothetical protein M9936_12175 [Caldilinea sp.]|nr:hypothetical protein [Caldilinea sp.]MCW5844162.1 hypothetical protein [Caldilinea sp.]
MESLPIWEVYLYVDGPVTVKSRIRTTERKGFHPQNPFYSDVQIESVPSGLRARLTARAQDKKLAYKAGVYFFGQMLDVLTLRIKQPMYLGLFQGSKPRQVEHNVRRMLDRDDFTDAFQDAHELAVHNHQFLRSLGWFRKGLTADDPLDKFLAFWNSIEIVASSYYRFVDGIDQERASNGSKSQIWECFKLMWGVCDVWPVIAAQRSWIDDNYAVRTDIAHGVAFVNIQDVEKVAARLPDIEEVSYQFLLDWKAQILVRRRFRLSEIHQDRLI